jgi:predicted nucleic acid-binding protein
MLVVDASVTAAWCFEDETDEYTEAALDAVASEGAVVPGIWPFEMANVLALAERRGRLTATRAGEFLISLDELAIDVDGLAWLGRSGRAVLDALLPVSRRTELTAYDAAYLDLAIRRALPLATRDERLRAAALRETLVLFDSLEARAHTEPAGNLAADGPTRHGAEGGPDADDAESGGNDSAARQRSESP